MTWYAVENTDTPSPEEIEARDRLDAAWQGAPLENLEVLSMLLAVARDQVIAYGPAIEGGAWVDGYYVPAAPPERFVLAQLRQAQNLWNAGTVNSSGDIGVEQFSFTPRPLDKVIRQIIRPVDGKPHVL